MCIYLNGASPVGGMAKAVWNPADLKLVEVRVETMIRDCVHSTLR
jgi:hypothetical protein